MCGVSKLRNKDINGYSNEYWGWGAEDDDLSNRVRTFYKLKRVPRPYDKMEQYHAVQLSHDRDGGNPKNSKRGKILEKWKSRWMHDGINVRNACFDRIYFQNLKYKLLRTDYERYYVNITVAL